MQNRQLVILGGGESGVGAALLAQQKGYQVFVSDRGSISPAYRAELELAGIAYESGQHTESRILAADEVIKSPGIPDTVPLVQQLVAKGIPVIAEIEFAWRYVRARIVGITGSNGKTTTTLLTYHLLKAAGLDAKVGGNVGHSFARMVAEEELAAVYVLELSSFQLDGIRDFRADLGAVLNITPDHLDRYDYQLDNYIDSKLRMARNQQPEDHFLYWADDANVAAGMARNPVHAKRVPIHSADLLEGDRIRVGEHEFDLGQSQLRGRHNALNACFAARIALEVGATADDVQAGLNSYQPSPHRLEVVGAIGGVTYINDSKATNVDAVYYALDAMRQPTVWIAGGTDKGNEYAPLQELVQQKVKALVCLGLDNSKLRAAFGATVPTLVETQSAQEAVTAAHRLAAAGDTVLLSPACASFDLFRNYEDRGQQFRAAVEQLRVADK